MTTIKPFASIRPRADLASAIAALPYDVYNRSEAKAVTARNPQSFLKIDRAETQFPDDTDMYSQQVYDRARDTLQDMIDRGFFVRDSRESYYVYELTMPLSSGSITQTGLVATASIDDYLNGIIKKHENTRADKEEDRIRHVDTCGAQTGPIFLAYRAHSRLSEIIASIKQEHPAYDFVSEDQVHHRVWLIYQFNLIHEITEIFSQIPSVYIADGHHRAASAVKVGLKRRQMHPDYDGSEAFNYFLSVLFPAEDLHIFDYNRVVKDLNGHDFSSFMDIIKKDFDVTYVGKEPFAPSSKSEFGMYTDGNWYQLQAKKHLLSDDPVDSLDVSILQNTILNPVLGITDPKTDSRISFIGGIRGLDALSKAVDEAGGGAAFSMYPTSMEELLMVADAGKLMPPKSTWFEPKLRSGLFIHRI